ncbi:hypothetical protein RHMOL_Rhmol11G0117100 [Rhododendron molle]|nr:hypothetical protein RHMOL_Rhmol11G0117100 [Rhododendron molle]
MVDQPLYCCPELSPPPLVIPSTVVATAIFLEGDLRLWGIGKPSLYQLSLIAHVFEGSGGLENPVIPAVINSLLCSTVYSSWDVGKLQCFSMIKERFSGPNVQFCVIGDGWEECEAAQAMRWPFVKISVQPGGSHRFPGLSLRTLSHYFSIVYGNTVAKEDD